MKPPAAPKMGSKRHRQPDTVTVSGIPPDQNTSFRRGAAAAPTRIPDALHSDSTKLCTENGLDPGASNRWREAGQVSLSAGTSAMEDIVRAYKKAFSRLNLLHFDPHPDLYDDLDGNPYSHASPFAPRGSHYEPDGMSTRDVLIMIMKPTFIERRYSNGDFFYVRQLHG